MGKNNLSQKDKKSIETVMSGGKADFVSKNTSDNNKIEVVDKGNIVLPNKKFVFQNFNGKILKRDKSLYLKPGVQPTFKKGTKWEDIDKEFRNKITFIDDDFETQ